MYEKTNLVANIRNLRFLKKKINKYSTILGIKRVFFEGIVV